DASLSAFQEFLEKKYNVKCSRAFRKTDDDLPGLDNLDSCDVMLLFTRRLTISGATGEDQKVLPVRQAHRRHPHRESRVSKLVGTGQRGVRRKLPRTLRHRTSGRSAYPRESQEPSDPGRREAVPVPGQPL